MQVKKVKADQIRKLRHIVLRKGKPFSTTSYLRDNEDKTFHLACQIKNKTVSCATFYPERSEIIKAVNAYRLRGMATLEEHRKEGFGKQIMLKAFEEIKKNKGDLLWCNARIVAVEFYKKLGLKTLGETFNISDIGPHYLMYKKL